VTASALAERAACAAMFWARPERRDAEAIRGAVAGLSDADHAAVVALLRGAEIPALSDDELLGRMLELGAKARGPEHKILPVTEVKSVATIAAGPVTGSGTFTGYLAGFGRDHGGDTIGPYAMDKSVAAVNSGEIVWHLTDGHSPEATAIVATVTAAAIDSRGLRIEGQWAPTQAGQNLREMVKSGMQLGLSIDYYPVSERPDGMGGRFLDEITIVGGAITPRPMNSSALITEGKHAASVPVIGLYDSIQAGRRDPDRDRIRREDAMLAAASWPPPGMFGRETSLALLRGAAAAKAARLPADDGARLERERWQAANRYSADLSMWLAANR